MLFGQRLVARRDWRIRKNLNFFIGCSVTACIVLPQKSCGNKIPVPQISPGDQPLAKEPEDSGYEIGKESNEISKGPRTKML